MRLVVRFAGVEFATELPGAGRPGSAELWRCLAGIAALIRALQAGEGNDRFAIAPALQHPAAGASAELPFRDEVVQFKTRRADGKIGWRDLA